MREVLQKMHPVCGVMREAYPFMHPVVWDLFYILAI